MTLTGKEFRSLRQQLGLTQRQLSERLGLHLQTIWQYEKGWRAVSDTAAALLQHLAGEAHAPQRHHTTPCPTCGQAVPKERD